MTESELLERLDLHMARGNEIMAEANEIHRDHREFIREISVRQERVTQQLVAQIAAGTEELRDLSLATKQHTQALSRMLDRFD